MAWAKERASEEEQTEFNSAIATLRRIDEIKKGLIIATIKGDVPMKFNFLKAYFLELVSVMDNKDDKEQRKRFHEVRKQYQIFEDAKRTGASVIPRGAVDSLEDWEIELKNIEQKYGMNMPKKSDPRYALASR